MRNIVMPIPDLEPHCGSWVVVSRSNGKAVLETFDRSVVERVDQTAYEVLTAAQWLGRVNKPCHVGVLIEIANKPKGATDEHG